MPATLATISGEWLLPDGTDLIDAIDYITAVSYNENGRLVGILRDASGGVVFSGRARPKGGTITLPVLPQAGVLPEGAHWRMVLKPRAVADWMPATIDFTLSGDCKWSDLIGTLSGEPIGPSLINQAEEALADALAAAAAAHAERLAAEAAAALAESNAAAASGATDAGMTAIASDTDTDFAGLLTAMTTKPRPASAVTKGLYERTQPKLPGSKPGEYWTFRVIAEDPNHAGVNGTGRIWGVHQEFQQLGLSDDDCLTWRAKSPALTAGSTETQLAPQSMCWSNNFVWLTVANPTNRSGEVWRFPKPGANGNPGDQGTNAIGNGWTAAVTSLSNGVALSATTPITLNVNNNNFFSATGGTGTVYTSTGPQIITWTGKAGLGQLTGVLGHPSGGQPLGTLGTDKMITHGVRVFALDGLTGGPAGAGGLLGGQNSTFRNSSFAVAPDESVAYVGEYGAANIASTLPAWTDGYMALGSPILSTLASEACTQMIGLSISVAGAGPGGVALPATVMEVLSYGDTYGGAQLRLSMPARTAAAGTTVTFPSASYGNGNIPGGPNLYKCTNPGAANPASIAWSKAWTFRNGKHIHAVQLHGGLPWVGIGDLSPVFPGNGIWIGNHATNPTLFQRRSLGPTGEVPRDPINMLRVQDDTGRWVIACESDSSYRDGPLIFSDATGTGNRVLEASCTIPQPYTQTMRGLTYDPATRNLYWFGTSEGGALGPTSCIWMARAPWTVPVMLEDVGSEMDSQTVGDGVVSNGYLWMGTYRIRVEKFLDQA